MMDALIEELLHLSREVLVRRDLEDMSFREIAHIVGAPACRAPRPVRALATVVAAWNGAWMGLSKEMLP
jgi:hypothetical protein